jgi:hypothetical protein
MDTGGRATQEAKAEMSFLQRESAYNQFVSSPSQAGIQEN